MATIGKVFAVDINGNIHFGVLASITTRELRNGETTTEYEFAIVQKGEDRRLLVLRDAEDFVEITSYFSADRFIRERANFKDALLLADRLDEIDDKAREAKRPKDEPAPATPSAPKGTEDKDIPF